MLFFNSSCVVSRRALPATVAYRRLRVSLPLVHGLAGTLEQSHPSDFRIESDICGS